MDGYLTLKQAIPRGDRDAVAYKMGVVGATVCAWCREPGTDEDAATGRRSPLDRVCDLISAVFDEVDEEHAELIADHVQSHLANLKAKRERRAPELGKLEEKLQSAQMLISERLPGQRGAPVMKPAENRRFIRVYLLERGGRFDERRPPRFLKQ